MCQSLRIETQHGKSVFFVSYLCLNALSCFARLTVRRRCDKARAAKSGVKPFRPVRACLPVMAPVCHSAPGSGDVEVSCRRSVPTCGCQRPEELSFQHHGSRASAIQTRRVLLRHNHVSFHYRGCLLLLPAPPNGHDGTGFFFFFFSPCLDLSLFFFFLILFSPPLTV